MCFFMGFGIHAFSQQYVIRGTVVDSESNEPLIGASITLEGEAGGTTTDFDGVFSLIVYNADAKKLIVSYMGYSSFQKEILIDNEETDLGNILMIPMTINLEGLIVRASLEGQQKALNQQRTADNVKNIISADLIGKFPDLNVAEAMQRVPGVNIQRDKGEGSTVSLRGTPPHFTTIQINGEQIPSVSQSGSRNETLDLIPADQLSSMEITKAPTPDMDGDAIGGVINLRTPTARGKEIRVRAESGLGYSDISGNLNGIGKLRLDKRFLYSEAEPDGRLGVMISGSFYNNNNSQYRTDASWQGNSVPIRDLNQSMLVMSNHQYRIYDNKRERIGIAATIDYHLAEDHKIIFNYMLNRRKDEDVRNRFRLDMDRSGVVFESLDSIRGTRARRMINIWDELKTNQSLNLEGSHKINNWALDWNAYYSFSRRDFSSDRGDFARDGVDIIADNPGGIYADVPRFRMVHGEQDLYDPFLYDDFRRYEEDVENTDANDLVGRIDFTRHFDIMKKYNAYFKFGAKYRTQKNNKFRDNKILSFNDPNGLINTSEAFLRTLSGEEPAYFLYSDYRFGPTIGRAQFQDYINSNRRLLTLSDDAWDSERLSLEDTYGASEDILGAYVMTRIQLNQLMVLAGVRYEYNEVNYDAFDVERSGTEVIGTPVKGGNDYGFVLPNLHLKYNFNKTTLLRFSALYNYARPNFVDIVPFVSFDEDAVSLYLGNPDLQPAKALNFDFMFEKYFTNIGIFSVGTYFKSIDKFQFTRIDPSLEEDFPGYPNTQGFRFRQEQNGEKATVAGIEMNFIKVLDFLPGFLKYFNLNANYTYTFSDAFTQDREGISMPGQAAHTFNIGLSYDYKAFSGSLSGNYNGTFIQSLASKSQDDIYQLGRFQLDANVSYKIAKNWQIYAEMSNITNAPSIRYQGERVRISRVAYFGWSTRAGVSFRF